MKTETYGTARPGQNYLVIIDDGAGEFDELVCADCEATGWPAVLSFLQGWTPAGSAMLEVSAV